MRAPRQAARARPGDTNLRRLRPYADPCGRLRHRPQPRPGIGSAVPAADPAAAAGGAQGTRDLAADEQGVLLRAEQWPEEPEIVERVAVRTCVTRGPAVDLVLDRGRENRSQLVFTRLKGGREALFSQSPRTNAKARPRVRLPLRGPAGWRACRSWWTATSATRTASHRSRPRRYGAGCRAATTAYGARVSGSPSWSASRSRTWRAAWWTGESAGSCPSS
jgi:hypothetical protein